ncbi:MAG: hypothetical protein JSS87_09375 [Acidobacteria bacterium]|nr:hypothetical protein [Acidobacteriota bacterium]
MSAQKPSPHDVDQFILDEIDSVPHLEALLLLWRKQPRACSVEEMAKELFIPAVRAAGVMHDLVQRNLIVEEDGARFRFDTESEKRSALIEAVDETYRRELVRISKMIHSNATSPMREFARAFDFRKRGQ